MDPSADSGSSNPNADEPNADRDAAPPEEPAESGSPAEPAGPPSDIVLSVTPNGLMIASEDERALDEIEALLGNMVEGQAAFGPQYTVFYLKHESAADAKQILEQALTGETDTGSDAGGGLLGDFASQAMGDLGGGLLGGILGDDSLSGSGDFVIVANERLNALFVQASAQDLALIEDLLKIIDQEESPEEVLTAGTAHLIPLDHAKAAQVAEQIKVVYADRIEGGQQQQQQGGGGDRGGRGGPSPEDFIRAIAGGGGGRGGRGGAPGAGGGPSLAKMTVGVDESSNSLIVRAPDPLFQEVKRLAEELDDRAAVESSETMHVVTLKHVSAASLQTSLQSILGESAQIGGGASGSGGSGSGGSSGGGRSGSGDDGDRGSSSGGTGNADREAIIQRIRERFQQGGGPPNFGGGPPSFGGGRGPSGRGGR